MSILANPASATLSLFQSMMYRPSIAPALMGTMSGRGELLSTMPPTCWLRPFGASISCGASSSRSRQPCAFTRSLKSGSCAISSRRSAASWECSCFESRDRCSCGSPRALPRSWTMPLTLYVVMAPVKTAYSGPKWQCTRSISSSLRPLGKSRSMSGSVVMSSEMNRSRVRSHFRGSTWLMPMRYPTSSATDEPRPLPGGRSSTGVSGSTSPRSSMMR